MEKAEEMERLKRERDELGKRTEQLNEVKEKLGELREQLTGTTLQQVRQARKKLERLLERRKTLKSPKRSALWHFKYKCSRWSSCRWSVMVSQQLKQRFGLGIVTRIKRGSTWSCKLVIGLP